MKKIIGIILSVIGIIGFLSLYVLMVAFKDSDIIGYVIFATGFVSITIFLVGAMMYRFEKDKEQK